MVSLDGIVSVLLETQAWPAVYVGDLPKRIKEVMRKTIESFAITFEDKIDRELLSRICEEMNYTEGEGQLRGERL